uniref:C-C motif chemokine 20 isoform X1 n=1 Tax=Lonchura striata TaxID=40157 RepID=UPI001293AB42|nr:C-C motif chemokine 20 isoform X1 [Lonchura striata domestica]
MRELDGWGRTVSALDRMAKWGLFILLLSFAPAHSNQDCCLSYTKARLPRKALKGYTEQLPSEVCDIPAIIFHTASGRNACVNPNESWVKKHLLFLSQKLRKMSV